MPKDYNNLKNEELDIIIRDGLKTEFWQVLTYNFKDAQQQILDQIISLRLTSWDDLVRIVNLIASYKTREEFINWPLSTLRMIEIERNNNEKLGQTPSTE